MSSRSGGSIRRRRSAPHIAGDTASSSASARTSDQLIASDPRALSLPSLRASVPVKVEQSSRNTLRRRRGDRMTRLMEGRNARSRPARSPPDRPEPVTEVVTYSESSRRSRWAAAVDLVQQVRGVVSFKAATCIRLPGDEIRRLLRFGQHIGGVLGDQDPFTCRPCGRLLISLRLVWPKSANGNPSGRVPSRSVLPYAAEGAAYDVRPSISPSVFPLVTGLGQPSADPPTGVHAAWMARRRRPGHVATTNVDPGGAARRCSVCGRASSALALEPWKYPTVYVSRRSRT